MTKHRIKLNFGSGSIRSTDIISRPSGDIYFTLPFLGSDRSRYLRTGLHLSFHNSGQINVTEEKNINGRPKYYKIIESKIIENFDFEKEMKKYFQKNDFSYTPDHGEDILVFPYQGNYFDNSIIKQSGNDLDIDFISLLNNVKFNIPIVYILPADKLGKYFQENPLNTCSIIDPTNGSSAIYDNGILMSMEDIEKKIESMPIIGELIQATNKGIEQSDFISEWIYDEYREPCMLPIISNQFSRTLKSLSSNMKIKRW